LTPFSVWFRVFLTAEEEWFWPLDTQKTGSSELEGEEECEEVLLEVLHLFTLESRTVPNWFWEGCRLICLVWNSTVSPGSTVPHQTDQFI